MERLLRSCRIRSTLIRECFAECLGVYIMMLFGCGAVAQVTTSENTKGQYLSINLGFALGTTFGVYVSQGVSGAHLNPTVSLSLCVLGRQPWRRLPFYIFSQFLGAFLGAATISLQYYDAIQPIYKVDDLCIDAILRYCSGQLTVTGSKATAGIFSTYPAADLPLWSGFLDQVIGTAVLLVCILALSDGRNCPASPGLQPLLVGFVVLAIGLSMGSNCGYPLNPARDLGPRVFTYIAGWGVEVFRAGGGWWWVPVIAPTLGALVGVLIYELLIEVHHPEMGIHSSDAVCQTLDNKQALELEVAELDFKNYAEENK